MYESLNYYFNELIDILELSTCRIWKNVKL